MKTVLLLEDNAERIAAFEVAVSLIPESKLLVWRDAHGMIRDFPQHLGGASLISLDHDLTAPAGTPDPGTGLEVCEILAKQAPVCPVVLHSTNYERVLTMKRTLEDADWQVIRVAPVGMGEEWIGTSWLPKARDMLCPVDESRIINLSAKTTRSQEKFNRRIRKDRGDRCEVCGTTANEAQIEAHHVLDRRAFPLHAKSPENILVLCQPCHSALTDCIGDIEGHGLIAYASLPGPIRERLAAFIEKNQPKLTTLIQALRRGRGYAEAVFWWRMEHKSLYPPEAFIRRHLEDASAYDAFLKQQAAKPERSASGGGSTRN